MSGALETSVHLIRGLPVKKKSPYDRHPWTGILWTDLIISGSNYPSRAVVQETSTYRHAIKKLIRERAVAGNSEFMLLKEARLRDNSRMGYNIRIHKNVVERLCLILPMPYIIVLMHFKPTAGSNWEAGTTFAKRLVLGITKNSVPNLYDGYFRMLQRIPPGTGSAVPLCDIVLGWVDLSLPITLKPTFPGKSLFRRESSKDVTVTAGNGAEIKCHKVILEAHSDVFAAMLSPNNGMREATSGRIEMSENSQEGLFHLIHYLYGMELKINILTCGIALELLQTAEKYKLEQLLEALPKLFLVREINWFTPNDLVELYFYVKHFEKFKRLQERSLSIMTNFPDEIRECERFREIESSDPKAAIELVWKLLDIVRTKQQNRIEPVSPDDGE